MADPQVERWGALRADFLSQVSRRWPPDKAFKPWVRNIFGLHSRFEPHLSDLRHGRPVPWGLIEALAEWARTKWHLKITAEMIADTAPAPPKEPPPPEPRDRPDRRNVWGKRGGWPTLFRYITGLFAIYPDRLWACDEMFCPEDYDFAETAEAIVQWVRRKLVVPPAPMTDEEVRRRVLEIMRYRGMADLAEWLRMLHACDRHTVMFPVVKKGYAYEPVGAWVVIPLTDDAARRTMAGKLYEGDIKASDVQSASPFVYLSQLVEPADLTAVGQRQLSIAQAHCLFYQLAWFTRQTTPKNPPTIISVFTNEDYTERLRKFGFQECGACMDKTDAKVVKLEQPPSWSECLSFSALSSPSGMKKGARYLGLKFAYRLFLAVLQLYQEANSQSPDWNEEPGEG